MTKGEKQNSEWLEEKWGSKTPHVGFVTHAREFLGVVGLIKTSYKDVLDKHLFEDAYIFPGHYLLCHAVELGLKSYLVQHGYTLDELRKKPLGHSLCNILAETEKCGIDHSILTLSLRSAISFLNDLYVRKIFEYRGKPGIIRHDEWPCVKTMLRDMQKLLLLLENRYREDSRAEKRSPITEC
ncbi:MAG: hypothetical protein MPK31_08515 [Gammaproteobacteria bacterium]|nr:hypothetical protein [Gammaproteobacteria bacterium]MDA8003026.1 hypothetical protein [Alphaproteobacteria bacterium]